jgi:hypothetical protein
MLNSRVTISCIILTLLAAVLQAAPGIFGESFALAVCLCGFPVYIAARFNSIWGIAVYLAAAAILAYFNTGEALFFICTNGFIGLSLGILKYHFKSNYTIPAFSALIVNMMLFIVNYFFKINIIDNLTFKTPVTQALALFPFLYIYCLIYFRLAVFANKLLRRNIEFNIIKPLDPPHLKNPRDLFP